MSSWTKEPPKEDGAYWMWSKEDGLFTAFIRGDRIGSTEWHIKYPMPKFKDVLYGSRIEPVEPPIPAPEAT